MMKGTRNNRGVWLWPAVTVLMLIGMVGEAATRLSGADAQPHLARCRAALENFPMTITGPSGNTWSGTDEPVPDSAVALLQPNWIVSRDYVQQGEDDLRAFLLIVDCSDANDLQGHYPLNCYPAQGQTWLSTKPRVWHLPGLDIPGTEYEFANTRLEGTMVVYNFFVTPLVPGSLVSHPELNGAICPDIKSVYTSGEDYQRRYFGAAEFQLVFQTQMTTEQRDQAFVDLLAPNLNVIRTLMNRQPGGK
jgi:Protein of unknown function (DUF3485)